jgi:hypothetical protein
MQIRERPPPQLAFSLSTASAPQPDRDSRYGCLPSPRLAQDSAGAVPAAFLTFLCTLPCSPFVSYAALAARFSVPTNVLYAMQELRHLCLHAL